MPARVHARHFDYSDRTTAWLYVSFGPILQFHIVRVSGLKGIYNDTAGLRISTTIFQTLSQLEDAFTNVSRPYRTETNKYVQIPKTTYLL